MGGIENFLFYSASGAQYPSGVGQRQAMILLIFVHTSLATATRTKLGNTHQLHGHALNRLGVGRIVPQREMDDATAALAAADRCNDLGWPP